MFKNTCLASPVDFDTVSSPFWMLSVGHYGPQCRQRGYLSRVEGTSLERVASVEIMVAPDFHFICEGTCDEDVGLLLTEKIRLRHARNPLPICFCEIIDSILVSATSAWHRAPETHVIS